MRDTVLSLIESYCASNQDADKERALVLCEQHGLDYDTVRAEVDRRINAWLPKWLARLPAPKGIRG